MLTAAEMRGSESPVERFNQLHSDSLKGRQQSESPSDVVSNLPAQHTTTEQQDSDMIDAPAPEAPTQDTLQQIDSGYATSPISAFKAQERGLAIRLNVNTDTSDRRGSIPSSTPASHRNVSGHHTSLPSMVDKILVHCIKCGQSCRGLGEVISHFEYEHICVTCWEHHETHQELDEHCIRHSHTHQGHNMGDLELLSTWADLKDNAATSGETTSKRNHATKPGPERHVELHGMDHSRMIIQGPENSNAVIASFVKSSHLFRSHAAQGPSSRFGDEQRENARFLMFACPVLGCYKGPFNMEVLWNHVKTHETVERRAAGRKVWSLPPNLQMHLAGIESDQSARPRCNPELRRRFGLRKQDITIPTPMLFQCPLEGCRSPNRRCSWLNDMFKHFLDAILDGDQAHWVLVLQLREWLGLDPLSVSCCQQFLINHVH